VLVYPATLQKRGNFSSSFAWLIAAVVRRVLLIPISVSGEVTFSELAQSQNCWSARWPAPGLDDTRLS